MFRIFMPSSARERYIAGADLQVLEDFSEVLRQLHERFALEDRFEGTEQLVQLNLQLIFEVRSGILERFGCHA
ncbi:hypothetical protein LZK76_35915 (plasmid) [Rhizobium leguminosarum]|nr:hypothetical protein LZK76_35915 [Rhizobium leguminosarum]